MDFDGLRSRALKGRVQDQYCLGVAYENGLGVEADYHKALFWYRKIAESDGSDVEQELERAYDFSEGRFYWARAMLCRKAAEKRLVTLLKHPERRAEILCEIPPEEAPTVFWYEVAAEQGNKNAQFSMGKLYESIRPRTYAKAFFWHEKAAQQGDADSQTRLGEYYGNGYGCKRSAEQSMYWYEQAAVQGEYCAQSFLANKYRRMGKWHEPTAHYWFLNLAHRGDLDAQETLAYMHAHGECGLGDPVEAYAWLATCNAGFGEGWEEIIDEIASRLTSEQLIRAKALAAQYIANYVSR
jgi:TPR repeat protein